MSKLRSPLFQETEWYARGVVISAFRRCYGSVTEAAKLLGISRTKLVHRMDTLGLDWEWRGRTKRRMAPIRKALRDAEKLERAHIKEEPLPVSLVQ